jgi:hypothetical protein
MDPERLESQRAALSLVPKWTETRCSCGKRTTRASGECATCFRAKGLGGSVTTMTDGQLVALLAAVRSELKRRRDEIDAAMEGA